MTTASPSRPRGLIATLVAADLRRVTRDPLMAGIIAAPLAVALIFRFAVPDAETLQATLAAYLGEDLGASLARAAPLLLMSLLTAIAPGMVGAVYGLLLVGERDERTMMALRVMPVSFARYLAARLFTPLAFSVGVTIVAYPVAGLAPLPVTTVALIAIVNAISAPVVALAMAAIARNKMAALAVMRVANSVLALPVLAYFAVPPMLYLAWLSPAYWQMKSLWLAADAVPFLGTLAVAAAMNILLLLLFYALFERQGEP
ncbi:MAG: hypothetical protein QME55_02255 [Brevundimonas sp.]|nr:hypothetical protein [Brevundimonas sp.]MDI6623526.1 hypothetical protein [Brevundimonas sp.]MDQ7813052.1 hypothetical protein [Brevundimonas sp.]